MIESEAWRKNEKERERPTENVREREAMPTQLMV